MPHFVRLLEKHSTYEVLSDNHTTKQDESLTRGGSPDSSDNNHDLKVCHYNELLNNVIGSWYEARTGQEEDPFYELMVLNIFLLRFVKITNPYVFCFIVKITCVLGMPKCKNIQISFPS